MLEIERAHSRPIFGYTFSSVTTKQVVGQSSGLPDPGQGARLIVTANLDHIVLLQQNPRLRRAYDHAWLRTIDGTPVWLYARLRGARIAERVTGADMVPMLLERVDVTTHRLFFLAANQQIADGLWDWASRYGMAHDRVAVEIPPLGFEADANYSTRLAQSIKDHGTTHLFLGVGCPKSEIWVDEHRDQLGDLYAFAVGAALGFFVGVDRRAPPILRRIGMEWIWRVYQEPGRLARRYFVRSWGFAAAVLKDVRTSSREIKG